ncbi:MAG: hypothetical protein K8S23_12090 [Candidatus Cloacimonetes bacterium]|nr:hypothetical protein [Candidatus Cloacimonadota bacterium]
MRRKVFIMVIFAFTFTMILSVISMQESIKTIDVFYKDKKPSLKTLEKTKIILGKHEDEYKISYYVITDSLNMDLIKKYNLPDTHFPFAVVINGKYSARINNNKIDFVHFPLFMKGIGRHEGNWSLDDLEIVLKENTLLLDKNILPELEHEEDDTPCDE